MSAICDCKKDYGVYKEHGKIYCNKCGEEVIEMSNQPEELDKVIYYLSDNGWKEHSFSYCDGIFEVTLKKGKEKMNITYDVYSD